jgi:hypothetical protein
MFDGTVLSARTTAPLAAAAGTTLPEVLTTVPLIPPVPARAKTRLKQRRKTATGSEVNRIDASNISTRTSVPGARRENVIQQLAADTRPGRDLAVLRDLALAGGIRCDRK